MIERFCPQATEIGRAILDAENGNDEKVNAILDSLEQDTRSKMIHAFEARKKKWEYWLEAEKNNPIGSIKSRAQELRNKVRFLENTIEMIIWSGIEQERANSTEK